MGKYGPAIAYTNFLYKKEGDVKFIDDFIVPKHPCHEIKALTKEDFREGLKRWAKNNRQFLYIACHGNPNGICTSEEEWFTLKEIAKITSKIDTTIFCSCNSNKIAEECHKITNKSYIGTTIKIKSKEASKFVIGYFDSLWDMQKKQFNTKSNAIMVTEINNWVKSEFDYMVDVFELFE